MRKAISPLVAEVLLIGFTVAVASIVIIWATSFTRTTTSKIGGQAELQLICSNAGIDFYGSVIYNITSKILFGYIKNTGNAPLGNISFNVIYSNRTETFLNLIDELLPQNIKPFSLSVNQDFNMIYVTTNCSVGAASARILSSQVKFVE